MVCLDHWIHNGAEQHEGEGKHEESVSVCDDTEAHIQEWVKLILRLCQFDAALLRETLLLFFGFL